MSEASAYYPSETRVLPLTLIQRERLLPVPGKVLVSAGERVQPAQIVAQTDLGGEVRLINVARLLRVPPSRAIKYLRVREGDDVTTHTIIATRGLLPSGRILSPADGFVHRIDRATGRVLIKVAARPLQLTAYVEGTVSNVMPSYGVVIETTGAIIQATVGFGEESYGVLHVAANAPTDVLRAKSIDVAAHGAIVIGGAWIDESALLQAQQLQARGLIAGSMDGKLLNLARNMPFPILLTEGLGHIPMAPPIFRLLQSHSGREASISASTRTRWGVSRPEILIPLPADTKPAAPTAIATALAVGVRVRVVRGSNQSVCGVVSALYAQPVQIESGARVHGAEVNLDGVGKTFVPFSNLEIIRV